MVSHKHKCIFVHIPRSGGTSMERQIKMPKNIWYKHLSARQIFKKVGQEKWDEYFKFTMVRNPWSRVISMYHQLHFNKGRKIGFYCGKTLKEFLELYRPANWEKLRQCDYLNYGDMDFIGRFENRKIDIEYISKKLGIEISDELVDNRTSTRKKYNHYTEFYNDETISMVYNMYKYDIELFGYSFGE